MYTRVNLMNQFRRLWEQHIQWTRSFIISTASNLDDLEQVTKRLLENPIDFANILHQFYNDDITNRFEELFSNHLLIAANLVNAAKAGDTQKAENVRKHWYANADEIANLLSSINPYWDKKDWTNMLYSHLRLTEEETTNRLKGNYEEDINNFDSIEEQALIMADTMALGLIRQFNL